MTPIDTVYEFAGMKFAGLFWDALSSSFVPIIVALAGLAFLVHTIADHGEPRRILAHLLYLCFMSWLVSPTTVEIQSASEALRERFAMDHVATTIRVPRFVYHLDAAVDRIQHRAVKGVDGQFHVGPFQWERVAAGVSMAQILDPGLRSQVDDFGRNCLWVCASKAPGDAARAAFENPLAPAPPLHYELMLAASIEAVRLLGDRRNCEEYRQELEKRARSHMETQPFHKEIMRAAERVDPLHLKQFRELYFANMVANTIRLTGHLAQDEGTVVRHTLGDPPVSLDPPKERSLARTMMVSEAGEAVLAALPPVNQWWSDEFTARQRYYIVATQGPYVYGFSLMIVLALFPLFGVWALLPGKWTVLVNYGKALVSIKLWPVGWALLSSLTAGRPSTAAFDPTSIGTMDVWVAVVTMYLATPALCFAVVALLSSATSHAFASIAAQPAGPGAGPLGAVGKLMR